jgi:hypothetical protein
MPYIEGRYFTEAEYSEAMKQLSNEDQDLIRQHTKQSDGSFGLSAVVGAVTGSALLGGLVGGDLLGGIVGDSLDGDLFD